MSGNILDERLQARPPRVKITYDVETGGTIEKREIPLVVGIFADLSGDLPSSDKPGFRERAMVAIDRDSFDAVLKSSKPRVDLSDIDNVLPESPPAGKLSGFLGFDKLEDFEPLAIVTKVDVLKSLYESRSSIRRLQALAECADTLATALGDRLKGRDSAPAGVAPELVAAFDAQVKLPLANGSLDGVEIDDTPVGKDSILALMKRAVAQIDKILGKQLSLIMQARNFKDLEATWRGMYYLVARTKTSSALRLRVLNTTRRELFEDLRQSVEFDQSAIFKMIYEVEYGTYGGSPYGLLVGAFEFGPDAESVDCLARIAEVAAAAHVPFIAAASPDMFGLSSFNELDKPQNLAKIFEGASFIGWNEFRDRTDSRYVSLVLPRVLLRLPYGDRGLSAEGLSFQEDVDSAMESNKALEESRLPVPERFLWGNAAFFLAERITNAFALYHCTTATWDAEGGCLVEGLPLHTYDTGVGSQGRLCPTEAAIADQRVKELSDLGFIVLSHCQGTDRAMFLGGWSTHSPRKDISDETNADAGLSATLPCVLAASRFAHYIKVIMREKIGSFLTRTNAESYLNGWIAQYVLLDDDASQEAKAAYPLQAARIQVMDVPGEPGAYTAQVCLQPHFQLGRFDTSIRLAVRLPA